MRPTPAALAVTVLARAPEPGRVKTRLARSVGDAAAAALAEAMLLDLLEDLASRPGLAVHLALTGDEAACRAAAACARAAAAGLVVERQPRGDLGDRMAAALAARLAEGAAAAAVVGSDCLDAPGALTLAPEALAAADAVLAPAADGGFVLLAVRRAVPAGALAGLPWGGDRALDATRAAFERLGWKVAVLDGSWSDVDVERDLESLAERLARPGAPRARRTRAWLAARP